MKNALTMVLIAPVMMCALVGVVVMFSDRNHGLSLLGLSVLLGVINFFVLKLLFKKLSQE